MELDKLEANLASLRGRQVAIIGDVMLDEYIWGQVGRISPDAPVPVVDIRRRSRSIGGAGNVAHNIAAAGGRAALFAVVGDDEAGESLRALLAKAGVDVSGVITEKGRPTTRKTRVVARGQHVVRLDEEVREPLRPETFAALCSAMKKAFGVAGAVLVSDYSKGVVTRPLFDEIESLADRQGGRVPVIVDPKALDFSFYRGCSAITPNQREAEAASRMTLETDDDLREGARRVRAASGAEWVLITLGERGMALLGADDGLHRIPSQAREVYDVTGAGDTVLAYFGLGLAAGMDAVATATIANLAAGVGVGKVGTATVAPAEILASETHAGGRSGKVLDLVHAAARVEYERSAGRKIVFTNGCFDLLHAGHVHLLDRARVLGDFLVVAVNTDASVRRLKGEGRPLIGEEDRVKVLGALDAVDLVLLFDEDTPLAAIEAIRPDVLVKGGDYTTDTIVGHELVLGYGGRVETISLVEGRSTSALISAIRGPDGK